MWSLLVHTRFHAYMHIPVQTCSTHEITQVFFFSCGKHNIQKSCPGEHECRMEILGKLHVTVASMNLVNSNDPCLECSWCFSFSGTDFLMYLKVSVINVENAWTDDYRL